MILCLLSALLDQAFAFLRMGIRGFPLTEERSSILPMARKDCEKETQTLIPLAVRVMLCMVEEDRGTVHLQTLQAIVSALI